MNRQKLIDIHDINREALRRSAQNNLLSFTKYNDISYQINWHHIRLAQKLNKVITGEIKRLIVTMPPRRGKSRLANVDLSAYALGKHPEWEILSASYSDTLATEMNLKTQRLMEKSSYSEVFPNSRLLNPSHRVKTAKRTSDYFDVISNGQVKGNYKSMGVGGGSTGRGMNLGIGDDLVKNYKEAFSLTYRNAVFDWYNSVFRTRLAPDGRIILISTRWHQDDLIGRLLQRAKEDPEADQWEVISFPEILEEQIPDDPRIIGQVLWPERYSLSEANSTRASLGSYLWNCSYQQQPIASEGNLIKREHFKFYDVLPSKPQFKVISIDTSFKDSKTSDYMVGQIWGAFTKDHYLIHQMREQASFTRACEIIKLLIKICPNYNALLIEATANGEAIIDTLKKKFSRIIAIKPKESKEARLSAVSPLFEAGNIYVPNPNKVLWVPHFINESCNFPAAANDDCVDSMTQALNWLEKKKTQGYKPIDGKSSTVIRDRLSY